MERALKGLLITLLALVAVPMSAFFISDHFVFQPRLPAINALLDSADPEDRAPPAVVPRLIMASHGKWSSPSTAVARSLLFKIHPSPTRGFPGWHPRYALWEALVSLHFSDAEPIGLYSALAYNGVDHGLNRLALRKFRKPLSALSEQEAATVVAMAWGPRHYARHPSRLAARRDMLLSKIQRAH